MDSISSALEYFFGSFPVAAALILIGACCLVYKVTSKITKMQDKVDGIDNLPCKEHKDSLKKHDDVIAGLREDVKAIDAKVSFLVDMVNSRQSRASMASMDDFSDKHSPRTLNSNGVTLLEAVKGYEFLNDHKSYLIDEMEKLSPKTALDVENLALNVLRINLNKDIFVPLKIGCIKPRRWK